MRTDAHRYLIAYDIPDDRRRSRVSRVLQEFGDRVQHSVFIVDGVPSRIVRIKSTLQEKLNLKADSVLICDLGRTASLSPEIFSFMGRDRDITGHDSFIV